MLLVVKASADLVLCPLVSFLLHLDVAQLVELVLLLVQLHQAELAPVQAEALGSGTKTFADPFRCVTKSFGLT